MEKLYIAGEKETKSEASLVLGYEYGPNVQFDQTQSDYNADYHSIFNSDPLFHISFKQADMETGTLSQVTKVFSPEQKPEIELSMNTLIDKNNYFGLLH